MHGNDFAHRFLHLRLLGVAAADIGGEPGAIALTVIPKAASSSAT
jgi:hypothetical protein